MKYVFDNERYVISITDDEIVFEEKRFGIKKVKINEIIDIDHSYSSFSGIETLDIITTNRVEKWKLQVFKKGKDSELFLECFNYIKKIISGNLKEIRKICNVCGKIICYNQNDVIKNDNNIREMNRTTIGSVASIALGTRYDAYEMKKISNHAENKIANFNKCPNCGSTDLRDYKDESDNNKKIDSFEEIKKYKELLDSGIINQEEFEKKKKELLNL